MVRVTEDEYMLQNHMIVDQKDDCFYKMNQHLVQEEEQKAPSKICILHSRYASRKGMLRDK